MSMKKYQVWADPIDRDHTDYTKWHLLGETDDINEAFYWQYVAEDHDKTRKRYHSVQVTQAVQLVIEVIPGE